MVGVDITRPVHEACRRDWIAAGGGRQGAGSMARPGRSGLSATCASGAHPELMAGFQERRLASRCRRWPMRVYEIRLWGQMVLVTASGLTREDAELDVMPALRRLRLDGERVVYDVVYNGVTGEPDLSMYLGETMFEDPERALRTISQCLVQFEDS